MYVLTDRRCVGCCPGGDGGLFRVTAWRGLRDWTEAGVWPRLRGDLLAELRRADLLDLNDCSVDGSHVRTLKGRDQVGPSPGDRARPGSKHHLIVERSPTSTRACSNWPAA